jgi:hypothetical protein
MKDSNYFAICPACGKTEWFELQEEDSQDYSKVNYLKIDGTIAYPNVYIRLKNKKYMDIICTKDECPMILIPFDVCDIEQRKKVFIMTSKERTKFAARFELLDSLE